MSLYTSLLQGDGIAGIPVPGTEPTYLQVSPDGRHLVFQTLGIGFEGDGGPYSVSTVMAIDLADGGQSNLLDGLPYVPSNPYTLSYDVEPVGFAVSDDLDIAVVLEIDLTVGTQNSSTWVSLPYQVMSRMDGQWFLSSMSADGTEGSNSSENVSITADGSAVFFTSEAEELTGSPFFEEAIRQDADGTRTVISPTVAENYHSRWEHYSADGRYAVFYAPSEDLEGLGLSDDLGGEWVRYDLAQNVAEDLEVPPQDDGYGDVTVRNIHAISPDGRFVLYESWDWGGVNDYGEGGLFPRDLDVFLRDMQTGRVTWVSKRSDGGSGHPDGISTGTADADVSDDGRYVVFASDQPNLVDGDFNGAEDVFVRDMVTGTLHMVSVADDGAQHFGDIFSVEISPDGRYVTFTIDTPYDSTTGAHEPTNLVATDPTTDERKMFVVDLAARGIYHAPLELAEGVPPLAGSDGQEILQGDAADNTLSGGGEDDTLEGLEGADTLYGGTGDDSLSGWTGDDHMFGGTGDDTAWGGDGRDVLGGGDGADSLQGGAGPDRLWGASGADTLKGEDGWDVLGGASGDDSLEGGDGNDALWGAIGNDTLAGGAGEDTLGGFTGDDDLSGGDGNDELWGADGTDTLDGGAGGDALGAGTGNDSADGGAGNDTVSGGLGDDTLEGGTGDDLIFGAAGNDLIAGGAGADTIFGGPGADVILFGAGDGADLVDYFGVGSDTLRLSAELWSGTLTEAQAIAQFGGVSGTDYLFDFGNGDSVTLVGQAALSQAQLEALIEIA